MNHYKVKNNKGFTLVELIVIVVILGVISAISVPSVISYIDEEKTKQEILDAKALMMATQVTLDTIYNEGEYPNYEMNAREKDGTINGLPNFNTGEFSWCHYYSNMLKDVVGFDKNRSSNATVFSSEHPYFVCFYVGLPKKYMCVQNSEYEPRKAYTVYMFFYQQTPNSNLIVYNGDEWITDIEKLKKYPYYSTKKNYQDIMLGNSNGSVDSFYQRKDENYIVLNGETIYLQGFFVQEYLPYGNKNTVREHITKYGKVK